MTGIFKNVNGQRLEMTQEEVDAFEASRPVVTEAQKIARIVLTSNQFWLSISSALSLTPADGSPKAYITAVIQGSTRLTDAEKSLAIAALESSRFARADEMQAILETIAMDLTLGNPAPDADEPTRLAAAQGALDTLFQIGATI